MRINRAGAAKLSGLFAALPFAKERTAQRNWLRLAHEASMLKQAAPAPIEFQDNLAPQRPRQVMVPNMLVSLTSGRKRGTDFNEKPPGSIRFVCTCALDAVGLVVGLLLAFGMVVVAGAVLNAI